MFPFLCVDGYFFVLFGISLEDLSLLYLPDTWVVDVFSMIAFTVLSYRDAPRIS